MKNPLFRTYEPSDYRTFGLESSHHDRRYLSGGEEDPINDTADDDNEITETSATIESSESDAPVSRFEFTDDSSVYWPIIGLGTRKCGVAQRFNVSFSLVSRVPKHLTGFIAIENSQSV